MVTFILGIILIIASFVIKAVSEPCITGGKKEKKEKKEKYVTLTVGESADSTDYDAQFKFTIRRNDEYIRPVLQKGYLFDKYNVIAAWPYARGTVVDVGANIGTFAVPVSRVAEQVIAFEPQKEMFKLLNRNVEQNRCGNVETRNEAAGHTNTTAHMAATVADGSSQGKPISGATDLVNYGGIQLGEEGEECSMVTLDSLDIKTDMIKVDVEGAEPLVFWGARDTIRKHHPVILFERNYKGITEGMRRDMKLTDEVAAFDILKYAQKCGYSILILLPQDNFLIIHEDRFLKSELPKYEKCAAIADAPDYTTYRFKKIKWS